MMKQTLVRGKVSTEIGDARRTRIDVTERSHRQEERNLRCEEQRKSIDEITNRRTAMGAAFIHLCRQRLFRDSKGLAKEAHFFVLGFEELAIEVFENEIEKHESSTYVFKRVSSPVGNVFFFDPLVEGSGEKMKYGPRAHVIA